MSEIKYWSSCIDRFLRYVTFDTQSAETTESFPSTSKQLALLRHLADELWQLGLQDVSLDEFGYVMGTIPATTLKKNVPTIGFLAHVDTSPEMSGEGVKPILHFNYQGQDLILPDSPSTVLRLSDCPELRGEIGQDIITASGTTLLGADDKAGIAEILGAAEFLMAHPEIPHGTLRIAFTPDEEVGRGMEHFSVSRFGAQYAYTLDGGAAGELESETFCADTLTLIFHGFNTHPGYAKGKMVNSLKVAADFIHRLPKDGLAPETTEGFDGYVHPNIAEASVERTAIRFLIRDFKEEGLVQKEAYLEGLARQTAADWPGTTIELKVEESYRNMRSVLDQHPQVTSFAEQAIRRAGLEVKNSPIRGGTDGSRLSFMGVPTPNLFAGQHNIHSRLEWASVFEMHKAVEVIIELAKIWEESTGA